MSRRTAKVLNISPEGRPTPARYGSPARVTVALLDVNLSRTR